MAAAVDKTSKAYQRWQRHAYVARQRIRGIPHQVVWADTDEDIFCEHCEKVRFVILMRPGIVSKSHYGDWVCEKCHPIAATTIAMLQLSRVVGLDV